MEQISQEKFVSADIRQAYHRTRTSERTQKFETKYSIFEKTKSSESIWSDTIWTDKTCQVHFTKCDAIIVLDMKS